MNKPIANKLLDEIIKNIKGLKNDTSLQVWNSYTDDRDEINQGLRKSLVWNIEKLENNLNQLENEVIKELYLDNKWLIKIIKQSQKDNKVIDFMTTNDNVFWRNYYQLPTPNYKCNCECHNADSFTTCMGICCYKRKDNKDE